MALAFVNVNGVLTDAAHATIPVLDHGFLFGEGVYETLRTYDGVPFLFDRHMQRLRASAAMLHLDVPVADDEFLRRALETMDAAGLGAASAAAPGDAAAGVTEAYIRILLTRGVGDLSYDPAATPTPSIVVIVKPLPGTPDRDYTEGIGVVLVDLIRNHPRSVNPLIKSNNLLNNALAMQEALRRGASEGVFRNYRGELSECSQANLFIVRNGIVRTPGLDAGLLAGITRALVFEIGATLGIPVEEACLKDADLGAADEAFLTGTTKEIMPIVRVDDRPIASGRPGPVTAALLAEYRRRARELTAAAPG